MNLTEKITGTITMPLRGLTGKDGLSAYQVAVKNGFNGTEEEWLRTIATKEALDNVKKDSEDVIVSDNSTEVFYLNKNTREVVLKNKSINIVVPKDCFVGWRVVLNLTEVESVEHFDVGFDYPSLMFGSDAPWQMPQGGKTCILAKIADNYTPSDYVLYSAAGTERYTKEEQETIEKAHSHENKSVLDSITRENLKTLSESGSLFSNVLRGAESGSVVALRDVSPVEHKIECKVSGEDLSAVKVYRYGKNLCKVNEITMQGMESNMTKAIDITLPAGRYVLSAKFKQQGELTRVGMVARNTSYVNLGGSQVSSLEESGKLTYAFEITERTACKMQFWGIYGTSYTPTEGDAISVFSEIQLEIDNGVGEATAFEPYGCLEYTPKADGTVEGMTSLAPDMTIMTDTNGVVIDVIYNKDINKAFEELHNAIISLGGNV